MHVACDCIIAQERLQDWEEVLDQLVQRRALLPKFQFKCLEETLKRTKGRDLVSLISLSQPVVDLLLGVLRPGGVVKLGNVIDNVLNAGNEDLALGLSLVHYIVQRRKDLLLEHRSIVLADRRIILTNLSVLHVYILFVLNVEGLLGVGFGFHLTSWGHGPVLINDTFEA